MYSSQFQEIINRRRSNRKFDPLVEVPDEVIKKSLERAILSPNSSNMQLWEFYWIKNEEERQKVLTSLEKQSKTIRFFASKKVRMRFFPELHFILDHSVDDQMKIDDVLKEIHSLHFLHR